MKTRNENLAVTALSLAVQGALVAMCAMPLAASAQDADTAALTQPTNYVEIGAESVSKDSAKFGEYNGLNKSDGYLIGNFGLKGGDGYGMGPGTTRWSITGTDLGTDSRELGATVGNQGQWNLGINYDELQHNLSDTYQTPLQGSMGGNSFTLPSNFGLINTAALSTVGSVLKGGTQMLTPTQLADFHQQDVYSKRKNTGFTAGYQFNPQWDVKFHYNRLDQSGAKLMSYGTDAYGTLANGLVGQLLANDGSKYKAESPIVMMNPTNYQTDTYDLKFNWTGDKGYMSAGYYGSFFKDAYNSVTWPNPYASLNATTPAMGTAPTYNGIAGYPMDTMSTMPNNDFNQLNFSGGYAFSPTTRLAGGLSYSRNTQNADYASAVMQNTTYPQSLNALVKTSHADLRLTNQASQKMTLSAGLKYDERDNQTTSNAYSFYTLGGDPVTSYNTPESNRKTQAELAGDFRIDQNHKLRLAYNYEYYQRWCNNFPAGAAQAASEAQAGYYTNGSCFQVPESKENKLSADYRLKAGEAVNFNAGYSYAKRNSDVLNSFYNPMQGFSEGFENLGWVAFFDASRKEQLVKAGVNWQANEKLSLNLNGRYLDDKYDDSTLGVQKGHMGSANLDASYSYSRYGVVSAYYSYQKRERDMVSGAGRFALVAPTQIWSNQLTDEADTVGLSARQKGLMAGKLELAGDLTYSLGKSGYSTQVPYLATCALTTSLTCGSTPDIKNEMTQFKLTGTYSLDKVSQVLMGYLFQHLKSNDYYYNAYQFGYTSTNTMPTGEQAPNYTQNVVFAAYKYSFR